LTWSNAKQQNKSETLSWERKNRQTTNAPCEQSLLQRTSKIFVALQDALSFFASKGKASKKMGQPILCEFMDS